MQLLIFKNTLKIYVKFLLRSFDLEIIQDFGF